MGKRYTVAVDFDGVLHSYTSPWVNARTIPDPPVPGAIGWLVEATKKFDVAVLSTRNFQWGGRRAMRKWLVGKIGLMFVMEGMAGLSGSGSELFNGFMRLDRRARRMAKDVMKKVSFPRNKPAALIYIDDRAWRFEGTFPTVQEVYQARPWNKKEMNCD